MTRFTRLRPVNSLKHVVDLQGGLTIGTQANNPIIKAVDAPVTATSPDQVENTSTVSAVFLNVQVGTTSSGALPNVYMIVFKNPGGNLSVPTANAVGKSDDRKHVIHQEMIMTEKNATGIPRTLFKGVIKIPRLMKRFGVKDELVIGLFAPGTTFDFCIQAIYKEFK